MNKPTFRIRTKEENKLIMDTMEADFGTNVLVVFKEYDFWIKEGKLKEVFTVPKEISDLITKTSILEPYSAGIPIGSIWSNSFHLEIEGANMISNYTSRKIIVKTVQFLYGKPIFKENITKYEEAFDKNDQIIVIGENKLLYGIGRAEISSKELSSLKENTIVIKGSRKKPLDVGWYLRGGS